MQIGLTCDEDEDHSESEDEVSLTWHPHPICVEARVFCRWLLTAKDTSLTAVGRQCPPREKKTVKVFWEK